MNPSTSLGTRSKVGMAKPSPPIRQAGNIWHLLVIRGVCRRSLRSAYAHVNYRCRCRAKGHPDVEQHQLRGGVSNVDMDGNNALQIKAIGVAISTFETLPRYDATSRPTCRKGASW